MSEKAVEHKIEPFSVYLAGPVDGIEEDEARGWRERLAGTVPEHVMLYSPPHAILNDNPANALAVLRCNYSMIRACDALLANLTGPGRGFGTIREIEYALTGGQSYVAISGSWVRDSLMASGLPVFDTVDEAMTDIMFAIADARNVPRSMLAMLMGVQGMPDDTT